MCRPQARNQYRARAPGGVRIDRFYLPEDLLQRLFDLSVGVHRVDISHPPVIAFLAILWQVLLHIPSLVNLAAMTGKVRLSFFPIQPE
jgi:hypothetical protein